MKKSYLVLLPFLCGVQLVSAPLPAAAYVYIEHPGVSAVEVDTSVLGDAPSQQAQGAIPQPAPQGASAPQGYVSAQQSMLPQQSVPDAETTPAAPVAPVESAPAQQHLAKPFFTTVSLSDIIPTIPKGYETEPDQPQQDETQPSQNENVPALPKPVAATLPTPPAPVAPKPVRAVKIKTAPPVTTVEVNPLDVKSAAEDKTPEDKTPEDKTPEDKTPVVSLTPEETELSVPKAEAVKTPEPMPEQAIEQTSEQITPRKTAEGSMLAVPSLSDLSLDFDATSSTLSPQVQQKLDGLANQIKDTDMRLQIRGFAKGDDSDQSSARRMALSRALSVRSYLMDKGIKPVRLDVRALGSETDQMPIDRVDLVFVR